MTSSSSINEKLEDNKNSSKEKPIAIFFSCVEQNIQFPVVCYISDNFSVLKKKLFNEYPILKNKKIFYLANGSVINTSLTLEQNKIKNGTHILIDYIEQSNTDLNNKIILKKFNK